MDEVGYRLGLRKIHLAIEERTQGELPWLRQPRASPAADGTGRKQSFHHMTQDGRRPMSADFDHVFTGVALRRFEIGEEDMIDRGLRFCVEELAEVDAMRFRNCSSFEAHNARTEFKRSLAGKTHHPDSTLARWRRDGNDSVIRKHVRRLSFAV
jgi:hypothetical protein